MKHYIIYVPGIGDKRPYGRTFLLWFWRLYGLRVHYHPVGWSGKEDFAPKLERLINHMNRIKTSDNRVYLAGESAGANAALTAYSDSDKVDGVVCISGKIQNGQSISDRYYQRRPAFRQSMAGLPAALAKLGPEQRRRILSIHPIVDHTVPPADTLIPGANEKQILAFGHIPSIFHCLVFCGPSIAAFLRRL